MGEARFTVRMQRGGFPCELTITDGDTKSLMERGLAALAWLAEQGFEPLAAQPPAPSEPQATPAPRLADGTPDPAWCPIHGVAMRRREKNGDVWYSHRLEDGSYCRGKVNNGRGG